jgi:hypothetical protein
VIDLQRTSVQIAGSLLVSVIALVGAVSNHAAEQSLVSDAQSRLMTIPSANVRVTDIVLETKPGKGGLMLLLLAIGGASSAIACALSIRAALAFEEAQIERAVQLEALQLKHEVEQEAALEAHKILAEHRQEQHVMAQLGGMGLVSDRPSATPLPEPPPQRSAWDEEFRGKYGRYPEEVGLMPANSAPAPSAQSAVLTVAAPVVQMDSNPQPMGSASPGAADLRTGRYAWVRDLEAAPTVLACGEQGSGKTGKVTYLRNHYQKRGDEVWVIDPHAYKGQYPESIKLFGGGMNWKEIDSAMDKFITEIERRYKARYEDETYGEYGPFAEKRITLICEEMYQWSKEVDEGILKRFATNALSSTRKANMGILIVSQSDKVSQILGKAASGNKDLLENTVAKIQGVAVDDPSVHGFKRPANYAMWKPSGADTPIQVDYPAWLR